MFSDIKKDESNGLLSIGQIKRNASATPILIINNIKDMGNSINERLKLYRNLRNIYIRELGPEFHKMDQYKRDFIFKTYASIKTLQDNYVSSDDDDE